MIEMSDESNLNVGYDFVYRKKCLEKQSEDHDGWCRCDVRW